MPFTSTTYFKPIIAASGPKSPVGAPPPYSQQTPSVSETDFVVDPRDHARLKAAWEAMLTHRFLATKLLAVLPFYLSSIFIDIQTNFPLKVYLPPNSDIPSEQRRSTDSVSTDRATSIYTSESSSPRSSSLSSTESMHSLSSSWTTMHLARNVETVKGCKEAIWEEYEKLYFADPMPAVTRTARPESAAALSAKPSTRETFEMEWYNWEKLVRLSLL